MLYRGVTKFTTFLVSTLPDKIFKKTKTAHFELLSQYFITQQQE